MADFQKMQDDMLARVRKMSYDEIQGLIAKWLAQKDLEYRMTQLMDGDIAVIRLLMAVRLLIEEVPAAGEMLRQIVEDTKQNDPATKQKGAE